MRTGLVFGCVFLVLWLNSLVLFRGEVNYITLNLFVLCVAAFGWAMVSAVRDDVL